MMLAISNLPSRDHGEAVAQSLDGYPFTLAGSVARMDDWVAWEHEERRG